MIPMGVFIKGLSDLHELADPECYSWWSKQPIDMIEELKEDFEEFYLENKNDLYACELMAHAKLSEIKACIEFHKLIKSQLEAHERLGLDQDIHPTLRSSKEPNPEQIGVTIRRIMASLDKPHESK